MLDGDRSARLQAMVGMRNRWVHEYDDIDDSLVARAGAENVVDRNAFAQAIAGYLTDSK